MKYMGSKARHAKELLPIILRDRKEGQWYVEPFVGGANMIDKVDGNRIGADVNGHLIAMLKSLSKSFNPPKEISKEFYDKCRSEYHKNKYGSDALLGYVGVNGSYNGRFFEGGYAGVVTTKQGKTRNYPTEAYNNVMKQAPMLKGIEFIHASYNELQTPDDSIIYCDPPYDSSKEYSFKFDSVEFWKWCRDKCKQGHKVFVSEYAAPDDFVCVWEKKVNSSLTKDTGAKKATEKLFVHESQVDACNDIGVID